MHNRILALCCLLAIPAATAHAQSFSESGWTTLYTQSAQRNTVISSVSNNATLPNGTVNVVSNGEFAPSGTIIVTTTNGDQTVNYTSKTSDSNGNVRFNGCTGGTGTMQTGQAVRQDGNVTATAIGPDGTIYWGAGDGTQNDDAREPIKSRQPTGVNKGNVRVLTNTTKVNGLLLLPVNGKLYFTSNDQQILLGAVPGQVPQTVIANFPGDTSDNPAGLDRVPTGWVGGSIVVADDILTVDNNTPDLLYRVNGASGGSPTVSTIGTDPSGSQTFVDVAISKNRILLIDKANAAVYQVDNLNTASSTMSALTITGGLGSGVSPVGIVWDRRNSGATADQFLVALRNNTTGAGTIIRLIAPASGNAWTTSSVGSGFTFNANAGQVLAMSDDSTTVIVAGSNALFAFARCGVVAGLTTNCNNDGDADTCQVLLSGSGRGLPDCNSNSKPDACDISSGTSTDCNSDGVPDECATCTVPVDMVFDVDTSGSMSDEGALICTNINSIVSSLQAEGITVHPTIYGIGQGAGGVYTCLTSSVGSALGTAVPGNPGAASSGGNENTLGTCSGDTDNGGSGNLEDWGRAANVISGKFGWESHAVRLVINVSDEGPWCGSGLSAADTAAVNNAITTAKGVLNNPGDNVIVSTILASGYYDNANNGMEGLAVSLANSTGGTVTRELARPDLVEAMKRLVRDACIDQNDCNDDSIPDACQLAGNDCNNDGRLDSCDGTICNVPPNVASTTQWTAIGTTNFDYNMLPGGFSDADGDGIGQVTINSVTGGPGTATGSFVSPSTIRLHPSSPNSATTAASPYVVNFTVCDNDANPLCATATLTVFYNDPPVLKTPAQVTLAYGKTLSVPFASLWTSNNVISGDLASDGDTDGLQSTKTGTSAGGSFQSGSATTLTGGSTCATTTQDDSAVSFVAGTANGVVSCFVQICEELPANNTAVCSVTSFAVNVVQCTQNSDCTSQLCDTNTNTCQGTPDAVNDTYNASATSALALSRTTIESNDTGNFSVTSFAIVTGPANGGALSTIDGSGNFTYTAPATPITSDSFTYKICSSVNPAVCDTATVTINVNRAPVASNATIWSAIGSATATFNPTTTFTDADGHTLATLTIPTQPTGGSASYTGGNVVFTPTNINIPGTYTVTYVVCDSGTPTACDNNTVLTVIYNDPPVLSNQTLKIAQSKTATINFGPPGFFVSTGTINGDDPSDSETAPDDGIRTTLVGTAQAGPFANSQTLTGTSVGLQNVGLDTSNLSVTAGATLGLKTFWVQVCEEMPPTSSAVCSAASVAVTVVQCIVDADCTGNQICDTSTNTCVNRPDAVEDTLNASSTSVLNFNRSDLLLNDTGSFSASSFSRTATTNGGTVTYDSTTGAMSYTAPAAIISSDSFNYTICSPIDGTACDTATVTVNVNRKPSVPNNIIWAGVGDPNVSFLVSSGFTDADGNGVGAVTIQSTSAGANSSFTAGSIVVVPTNIAIPGTYTVNYTVCDNGVPTACTTSVLTAIYNDPPNLNNVTDTLAFNNTGVENFTSIFVNTATINGDNPSDVESPDDAIRSILVGTAFAGPFGNSASLNGTSISLQTAGLDTSNLSVTAGTTVANPVFYVQVCEEMPPTSTAVCKVSTVNLTIVQCKVNADCTQQQRCDTSNNTCVAIADAVNDTLSASATQPLPFNRSNLLANDTNYDTSSFSLTSLTTTNGGTLTYNSGTGQMSYTAPSAVITSDTFSYRVCTPVDLTACDTATVTINVNRAPVQGNATVWAAVTDPSASYAPSANFTDPDAGNTLGTVTIQNATGGTATFVQGNIIFTPNNPNVPGTYTVNYTACDNLASPVTACDSTNTLTVIYNDPPVLQPQSQTLPWTTSGNATFASFFVSTGTILGDDPADGDTDGIRTIRVGSAASGPFGNSATLNSTVVSLANTSLDTSDLGITTGSTSGNLTFYVQVCEERPATSNAVCAVTTLTLTVTECLQNSDCDGTNVCQIGNTVLENTCVPCLNTVGGASQDAGCTVSEPICNEALNPNDCVACINDSNPSGPVPDTGCTALLPACDDHLGTTTTCVECLQDADCFAGEVCDEPNHTCVPCVDNLPVTSLPTADDGCVAAKPLCELSSGPTDPTECVVCQATANINDVDPGCSQGAPDCDINPTTDVRRCLGCITDADCNTGLICNDGACVPCVDTAVYPTTDRGCSIDEKICLLATQSALPEPTGLVGEECVLCRDDAGPALTDTGCTSATPVCDALRQTGEVCVECTQDPDCAPKNKVCDEPNNICLPCVDSVPLAGKDDGCTVATKPICDDRGATGTEVCEGCEDTVAVGVDLNCTTLKPACDESGAPGTNNCVECTKNTDCKTGETCQLSTHTCVSCVDDASFPNVDSGCDPQTPVCAETGSISGGGGQTILTCVHCEDNKPLDTQTDEGCTSLSPICNEDIPGGVCVECNDNADCPSGKVCDLDNGTCVICLDDRLAGTIDTGCNTDLPVCELGNPGLADDHCVECEDDKGPGLQDWGCDATLRYCDEEAAGGPHCHECETDEDCPGDKICSSGSCVDPGSTRAVDDAYTTTQGVTLTVSTVAAGVAGNDTIPPGSGYKVTIVAGTAPTAVQGQLTLNQNGTFTFVPASGFAGTLTFSYTLTADVNGAHDDADVTITVNGGPRPVNDSVTTLEDTSIAFDPRINDVDPNGGLLTITRIVTPPTHGAAQIVGGQSITYTPALNYNGPDSLVYEVCNPSGLCATATVAITVTPVNDAPIAGDDIVTTPEDTGVLVVVLANDFDPDSATLDVRRITSAAAHGTTAIQPDDSVLYTPTPNYSGSDAFSYEVCDSAGQCDEAVVLVTVTPVNDAPVAGDDQTTTPANTKVNVPVLANDSDVDGDALTVSRIVTPPATGTVKIENDGTISYTPANTSTGPITFTYEVCDGGGLCDTADVKVTVGVTNDPPQLANDHADTAMDEAVTIPVLSNDSDPDGGALELQQVGVPPSGSAVVNANGTVTYTPGAGFVGNVSFSYTACDDEGACASAIVTVTVLPGANRPPIATDDIVSTKTGQPVSLDPTDNDVDPDGDPLAVDSISGQPLHGTVVLNNDGTVTYTPAPGFNGNDSFEVTVADGQGGFDDSTVTVVVRPDENKAPIANDDSYTDVSTTAPTELDVMVNDSDPNGDPIAIVDVVQPQHGTVSIIVENNKTRLVFTPDPGSTGSDTFTYTISDGRGGEATATVTITYPAGPATNLPPIATGEDVKTPEDTGVLIIVLDNDHDPDGDPLTVTGIAVPPRHGTVVIDDGGGVLYVPDPDYNGRDVFTYRVCDDHGECDTAVVSLDVTPVNDGPRANDDFYAVATDETGQFDVTLNDSDPELDALTVTRIVSPPAIGNAFVNPDNTVTYEPAGHTGTTTFIYEVCDTSGACDTAKVTVYISDTNHNPVAHDDEGLTTADESTTIDVLANDSDPDGDQLDVFQVEDPAHGTATIEDNQIVYTPDDDFTGTEIFFYTVCDQNHACATAFVVVEVTPGANTPPVAVDDTISTPENTPKTFDSTDNDIDFDGDTIEVISTTQGAHGHVTLNADGTLTYTPDNGYVGDDTFTVTISDNNGGNSTETVLVHVTPATNRPPDAVDDSYDAPSDVDTNLPVLVNDSDPDGDPLTIVDVVQPQHGVVSISADGTQLVLTPDPGYIGPDRFSYTITDGRGGYDTAFVDLVIGDRDHDGLGDGWEVNVTHTDPDDFDSDDDGLGDGDEIKGGDDPMRYEPGVDTDPLDNDTDDDGLSDGDEIRGDGPLNGNPTDPLDPDSDHDGVGDGVEVGVTVPVPGGVTDGSGIPFEGTNTDVWIPDADPTTTTDPNDDDSDDDGLTDGFEDVNGNGKKDGEIGVTGTPGTGETDAANPDTDGDGIQDGTELGLTAPQGTGTDLSKFQPDLDPSTTTDPRDTDTDDGGVQDGNEDLNFNGYQDPGEIDPNYGVDDTGVPVGFIAEGGSCSGSGAADGLMIGLVGLGLMVAARRRRRQAE